MNIEKIKEYAKINNVPIMLDDGLEFILEYIKNNNVKTILELGTAIGYSSIKMAKIDSCIKIDTIEIDKDRYNQALSNIAEEDLQNQISVLNLNIDEHVTNKKYDLIFVDAAKAQYGKYLTKYSSNLNLDGCMVFDNLKFHGIVDDLSLTRSRSTKQLCMKIYKFREGLINNPAYRVQYYENIGDGLAFVSVNLQKM